MLDRDTIESIPFDNVLTTRSTCLGYRYHVQMNCNTINSEGNLCVRWVENHKVDADELSSLEQCALIRRMIVYIVLKHHLSVYTIART